jgi:hypothetical protein
MNEVITIGVDIAKSVFQIHAVNDAGEPAAFSHGLDPKPTSAP